ncbi:hypothetical protein BH23GEM9_BH23GEM9_24720 [soil metagenome]
MHAKTTRVALTLLLLAAAAAAAQENQRPVHEPDFFPFRVGGRDVEVWSIRRR